ncbi:FAD-dependent monooxygenase [Nocardiopsis composta]
MRELTAAVVGGGIAGLASAAALAREGWRTTVLERAGEAGEVGAGVALTRNAAAALRGLGFDDAAVSALGAPTWASGTLDMHGRPMFRFPDDPGTRRTTALIGVHRRRLHAALLDGARAAGVEVVTGARVTGVRPGDPGGAPAVVSAGDRSFSADLVVGADGVRSAVRAALFPGLRPAYSGYSSWRAVVTGLPPELAGDGSLRQFWGPHAEFGVMPVHGEETYWYGYVRLPERTRLGDESAAASDRFAGWDPLVQRLVAATPPSALIRHDVHHLPGGLPRYARGRVVMVGDAAHAALPTMGQGAATALEDGLCVGLLVGAPVAAGGDLSAALSAFDAARRPRCRALARASVQAGRFGSHLGGGWRQALRNGLMRRLPPGVLTRATDGVMGWLPPERALPAAPPDRTGGTGAGR